MAEIVKKVIYVTVQGSNKVIEITPAFRGVTLTEVKNDTDIANTIANTHTHTNKALLDEYTPENFATSNHTHDNRYYTETEVDTLLSGKSDVTHNHTLSSLLEKSYNSLTDKPDLSSLHTHLNKSALDNLTQTVINNSHSHSNQTLLDSYTNTNTDITNAVNNTHTHPNKTDLDNYNPSNFAPSNHNHDSLYYQKSEVDNALSQKQDTLVSGVNIKTINNQSILGAGDIQIVSSSLLYIPYADINGIFFNGKNFYNQSSSFCLYKHNNTYYTVYDYNGRIYFSIYSDTFVLQQTWALPIPSTYKLYLFYYNNYIYICNCHLSLARFSLQTEQFEYFFSGNSYLTEAINYVEGYFINCYNTYIHVNFFDTLFISAKDILSVDYNSEQTEMYLTLSDISGLALNDTVICFNNDILLETVILDIQNNVITVGYDERLFQSNLQCVKYNPVNISNDLLSYSTPPEVSAVGGDCEGMVIYKIGDKYYTILGGFKNHKFLYEFSFSDNIPTFTLIKYLGLYEKMLGYTTYNFYFSDTNFLPYIFSVGDVGIYVISPLTGDVITFNFQEGYFDRYHNIFFIDNYMIFSYRIVYLPKLT